MFFRTFIICYYYSRVNTFHSSQFFIKSPSNRSRLRKNYRIRAGKMYVIPQINKQNGQKIMRTISINLSTTPTIDIEPKEISFIPNTHFLLSVFYIYKTYFWQYPR